MSCKSNQCEKRSLRSETPRGGCLRHILTPLPVSFRMYYITYVFSMAGYSGSANLLASSIQYIINVVMTVPALIWLDRWGRRKPLIIGAFFMMTWMFANAGILGGAGTVVPGGIGGSPEESMRVTGAAASGLIACTYLFVASFAPTWGPVSWVYPPELYPLRVRGKAVALSTSANWAFNTVLGAFVPPAFAQIRYKVYIVFGIFNLCMMIHAALLFPETAGKTLEDTEKMFEDPNGIPYLGTPAWKVRNPSSKDKSLRFWLIYSLHRLVSSTSTWLVWRKEKYGRRSSSRSQSKVTSHPMRRPKREAMCVNRAMRKSIFAKKGLGCFG